MRSRTSLVCTPSRRALEAVTVEQGRHSWKSSGLPLCGVAVISNRCRVTRPSF